MANLRLGPSSFCITSSAMTAGRKISAATVQNRTQTPFWNWIRNKLLAVERLDVTPPPGLPTADGKCHYNNLLCFPKTQSARSGDAPPLPGGVHHKLEANYYKDRDGRRAVLSPAALYAADASGVAFGNQLGEKLELIFESMGFCLGQHTVIHLMRILAAAVFTNGYKDTAESNAWTSAKVLSQLAVMDVSLVGGTKASLVAAAVLRLSLALISREWMDDYTLQSQHSEEEIREKTLYFYSFTILM